MLDQQPLVSIIMAVKDTAIYLPTCINSILNQTYKNWELLAVNDHSTDASLEILYRYAERDHRIKVFNSSGHKLIPALQEGYKHANGTLINRMDSDDKMPAYKLQVLVETWQEYGKGHIAAGGTEHFVDEGEVGGGFRRYEQWLNKIAKHSTYYQEIYKECVIPSHCWIIHKDDLDTVGAFNNDVYPEDYDLCFRFYRQGLKVIGIDKILHYWRDRSNRISRTWECYQDNRYFDLKLKYFYQIDRAKNRPLVIWGAGSNGKALAKQIKVSGDNFNWVCDNDQKIGKDIYGIILENWIVIPTLTNPQILITVASPEGKALIQQQLDEWKKKVVEDYWFFL